MLLKEVQITPRNIDDYGRFTGRSFITALKKSSASLRGKRVIHINATPVGGGVAEILKSLTPLEKSLDIDSRWYSINTRDSYFFVLTKKIHNSLQGSPATLNESELGIYFEFNKKIVKDIKLLEPDLLIVHDPQPLAAIGFYHKVPMVSRIHIDLSTPNQQTLSSLMPYLKEYDRITFSVKEFVPSGLPAKKIEIHPPAIDPLLEKNLPMDARQSEAILETLGVNPDKPTMTQVSRFDKWKDQMGVVQAYYIAKNKIPDLQLILLGNFQAQDDPEALEMFKVIERHSSGDPDIFLFTKPPRELSNDTMVRAIQCSSDVILQKSIREGFGLTVTEAMWQGKPVIGGNVGGIRAQIKNGVNGFLVSSPREASKRVVQLLQNPALSKTMGKKAKESVRTKFLMTRLLDDHIKLYTDLLKK